MEDGAINKSVKFKIKISSVFIHWVPILKVMSNKYILIAIINFVSG